MTNENRAAGNFDREPQELRERIKNQAKKDIRAASLVAVEGSPVYLFPSEDVDYYASQQWNGPAFIGGWQMLHEIVDSPEDHAKITNFVLFDDFNGVSPNLPEEELQAARENFQSSTADIHKLPGITSLVYSEREIADITDKTACSALDAHFQAAKIFHFVRGQSLALTQTSNEQTEIADPLFLIVHPIEFRKQQAEMLKALMSTIRQDFRERLGLRGNKEANAYIQTYLQKIYRHIWIDGNGEASGYTQPVFDSKKQIFNFEDVLK